MQIRIGEIQKGKKEISVLMFIQYREVMVTADSSMGLLTIPGASWKYPAKDFIGLFV